MMANPKPPPSYREILYMYTAAMDSAIVRSLRLSDKLIMKDIEDSLLPPLTDKIEKPRICSQKADWSSILPSLRSPQRIENPLVCIIYDSIVGKASRMKTDPKIWVPDTLQRDPLKLAGSIAQAVIHFLMGRKGFSTWWMGIDELRRDEIRAGLACDIAMSLPRHPEEATIKYAQQRTVPLDEANADHREVPNPAWKPCDPVWVPESMVPPDMNTSGFLGGQLWYEPDGRWVISTQLDKPFIEAWLRKTALKMADHKYVSDADRNRFKDLAKVVKWEGA